MVGVAVYHLNMAETAYFVYVLSSSFKPILVSFGHCGESRGVWSYPVESRENKSMHR